MSSITCHCTVFSPERAWAFNHSASYQPEAPSPLTSDPPEALLPVAAHPACSHSISLIRGKSVPFCSQSSTRKQGENIVKHKHAFVLSLIQAQLAGSRHGPCSVLTCAGMTSPLSTVTTLRLLPSLCLFIMSLYTDSDVSFITEAVPRRLFTMLGPNRKVT